MRSLTVNDPATLCLLVLATLYTGYFASPVIVPSLLAMLLAFALAPIVRLFERLYLPRSVGAAAVVFGLVGGVAVAGVQLSGPATEWLEDGPEKLAELNRLLKQVRDPIEEIVEAGGELAAVTETAMPTQLVKLKEQSYLEMALSETPGVVASIMASVFLLYFLLAAGGRIAYKLERIFANTLQGPEIGSVGVRVQDAISRYLFSISLINAGLGLLTWLWLVTNGIDDAALWGIAVAVLNFAPYIGAATGVTLLFLASLLQLESITGALSVVSLYALLTIIEGQLVTPLLVGRRLRLSPYIIFGSIIILGWMWGLAGVLMAVPLLVCLKIVGEQVPGLELLEAIVALERPMPNPSSKKVTVPKT